MKLIELTPIDEHKSFYGKAFVVEEEYPETFTIKHTLFSYCKEICVAEYSKLFDIGVFKWKTDPKLLTRTSKRHFKSFFKNYVKQK